MERVGSAVGSENGGILSLPEVDDGLEGSVEWDACAVGSENGGICSLVNAEDVSEGDGSW